MQIAISRLIETLGVMGKPIKAILLDFDGTLATRNGRFAGTLVAEANGVLPERKLTKDEISPFLKTGFPWHTPEQPHTYQTPDEWWVALNPVFVKAYMAVGLGPKLAEDLATKVRKVFLDFRQWSVYKDVVPCLSSLRRLGWVHYVLSNHVPELPQLVDSLGLSSFFADVSTSARTGFEKPHPEAFKGIIRQLPNDCNIWMIGDSHIADVQGANAIGLPAILVRNRHDDAKYCCASLNEIEEILTTQPLD